MLFAYVSSPAWASTITVNSLADDADGTDGECTLREAITSANSDTTSGTATGECAAGSGDDVIDIGVTGTVNLTGALPPLSSNIEIEGPGVDQFTVRRNTGGNYVIFRVGSGADVSLSGMTITNGNTEVTDIGGGIYNDQGTLTVTDSTVSDNAADVVGGILSFGGTLTVTDSTVSDNSALSGGGIYNQGGAIRATITRSTISGNSADLGGGVYTNTDNLQDRKALTITNSTISGNTATTVGAGVYNSFGLTVIEFSTITNNTAPSGKGSGVSSQGSDSARTNVLSSIISASTNTDVDFFNAPTNTFASRGYNLIGDGNATGAFNKTGDRTKVSDPKLDPLGSYGGPTQTHRLQSDSPAEDAGPPTDGDPIACPPPATDQRGVSRPQDGDADSTPACDIGSFELVKPPDTQAPKVISTFPPNGEKSAPQPTSGQPSQRTCGRVAS